MPVTIHIIDAFTQTPNEGNRAGVVLDADNLNESQMQAIAAFAGYSETAFVLKPQDQSHDVYVRYFTPTKEVPICGHATIATHYLRTEELGLTQQTITAKTGAGILPVNIEHEEGAIKVVMTQSAPTLGHIFTAEQIGKLLTALDISAEELIDDLPVQVASTGHSKIMVPMRSTETLDGLSPNMALLTELSEEVDCNGFFPFVISQEQEEFKTFGRMFAPAIGIEEDPVTGNANGPAGAYLEHYNILNCDQDISYIGHQGIAIGKPGKVEVRLSRQPDQTIKVQIAGHAVRSGTRIFEG